MSQDSGTILYLKQHKINMAKYIDIEQIRAKIERHLLRAEQRTDKEHASHNAEMEKFGEDYWNGYGDLAYALLAFIDSQPEEQPSKDLEEEIDRFEDWMETYNQADYPTSFTTRDIARHFAKWQKEQMMKDAVEMTVENGIYLSSIDCAKLGYKLGDKVKIIIVKKE